MRATKRIGCLTAAMLIGIMSMVSPAAEAGENLESRISTLEKTAGISSGDTLLDRVEYLEMQLSGNEGNGPLPDRISILEKELLGASISGETGGNNPGNITHLTDLEFFSKTNRLHIMRGSSRKDNLGNVYDELITGYNPGSESVEYYLDRQYNTFSATVFIMNKAVTTSSGHGFQWDNAEICIYGDEALLYKKTGFDTKMKPEEIMVDIAGVEFLKIEFRANYYIDTGSEDPLVGLGYPALI